MAVMRALVVADLDETAQQVTAAMRKAGFRVRQGEPNALLNHGHIGPRPDVLLASASLGLQRLALLPSRFGNGRPPTTLVFPDGDFATLAACVRAGFDYVMPPYLPELLRGRLSSCRERHDLTSTVAEMAAEASLHEYERELAIARDIQAGFLPEQVPTPPGWEVATEFRPARQVGGDFYDVFELVDGSRLGFVIADVCDKGVGAALFMALIRTLLRHTAEHSGSWDLFDADVTMDALSRRRTARDMSLMPSWSVGVGPLVQAVGGTNRYLARNHLRQGYFATLFFGVLDPESGALLYINGGHNPPVLRRADGSHTMLDPTGPAIGMLADSTYSLGRASLAVGDTLFMYTDGIPEARDPDGGLFGNGRMLAVVTESGRTATDLLGAMDSAVRSYVSTAEQSDDITMLALHWAAH